MSENPWSRLPLNPPFVLAEDERFVEDFNKNLDCNHPCFLNVNRIIREPFVGNLMAPVVLLSNNPGIGKNVHLRENPDIAAKMRNNLLHKPTDFPFVFLDPDYPGKFWRSKLKKLIVCFNERIVANSILNVVLCPYPSQKYRHGCCPPSQACSFCLVADAVKHGAVVVLLRPGKKSIG